MIWLLSGSRKENVCIRDTDLRNGSSNQISQQLDKYDHVPNKGKGTRTLKSRLQNAALIAPNHSLLHVYNGKS